MQNPFNLLVESGVLPAADLEKASEIAAGSHAPLAEVLQEEYGLSRSALQQALTDFYHCPLIEYDERLPVPPELLTGLAPERLAAAGWFPVIKHDDGSVVIASLNPKDPGLATEVETSLGPGPYEFHVCLPEDIRWFIEEFLHARPGELIGTERTGLAYWRNTMSQWRTVLACYRNDMAESRTALAVTRSGLALVTISFAFLLRVHSHSVPFSLSVLILGVGCILSIAGLPSYLRVRRARLKPPADQTLMEVTAVTLVFLENYQTLDNAGPKPRIKGKMLARLGDLLGEYCTIIFPSPASRIRTHLARERNVLAAQRTIAACNRTIYSRARTGLAFTRTGTSFISIGIGLTSYFGYGINTLFDSMLILIGLMMAVDGILWYMPAHRDQADLTELGTRFRLQTREGP